MKKAACVLAIVVGLWSTPAFAATGGYGDWNASTNFIITGGLGGPTVTVTTASQFINAVGSNAPYVVQFSGTFDLGCPDIDVRNNKSIIGLGTNATLIGDVRIFHATNVVVQNVFFTNPTCTTGDKDGITCQFSRNVWIDHCTFYDCGDGSLDITHASDFVTASWCKFYYTSDTGHNFVDLIGHSDNNAAEDDGRLHVTFHHNWWSTLCVERMPRVRFGRVHSYNNYFNAPGNNYCIRASISSEVFAVKNVFQNIDSPYEYFAPNGKILAVSNATINCTTVSNFNDSVVLPPYTYTMDETNLVAGIVTNNAGAGVVPVAAFAAGPTTGPAPLTVTFTNLSTGLLTNQFWSFGDSSTTNITTNIVSHVYNAGTFTVTLTASGPAGSGVTTQSNYIVATSPASPPLAIFTASPTNGVEPLAVTFSDISTGSPPLSLSWDFGDSTATNTLGGATFGHSYTAGTYTVTLLASNSAGTSTLVSNNLITVVTAFQAWQTLYFGCTDCPQADAAADPDGDGLTNQAEFLAGTNPTNSVSALRIISTVSQGNDVLITWTTAGGRTNAVQATAGDGNGGYNTNFVDVTTPPHVVIPGSGEVTTNYQDAGGATNAPSRYYRIRLVP